MAPGGVFLPPRQPLVAAAGETSVTTKLGLGLATLAGLFLLVGLIAYYGFESVAEAFLKAGWQGILAVAAFHLVPLFCSAMGWRALMSAAWPAAPLTVVWARLVREGASNLLPVLQVGGEVIGARILIMHGARAGIAGGGVVVDLTVEVMTQFLFTLLGVGFLLLGHHDSGTVYWLIVGLAIALPLLVGFVAAQHWGLFKLLEDVLERVSEKWRWVREMKISGLHDSIKSIYGHPRGMLTSVMFHTASWILGAGEIWIALQFMGEPVNFREALIMESLYQAVRAVGFAIPGALGVQEGGFILAGGLLGLGPDVAIALSLVKRARDLILGIPALAGWHFFEGRRLWIDHQNRKTEGD